VLLYYVLSVIYVLVCLVLLGVILLQQGRGGDIASAFGGSSSQAAFGARSGATLLTKVTAVCAVLFMLGALALAIVRQSGPSSVVRGAAPAAPQSAPAKSVPTAPASSVPAPATPAPASPAPAAPAPTPSK
jgi:preprotein translocase subunit SecG